MSDSTSSNKAIYLVLLVVVIAGIAGFSYFRSGEKAVTPGASGSIDRVQVEAIVRDYIANNPRDIIASVENMQKSQYDEQMKKAQASIGTKKTELENDPTSPVLGNPQGDVTIVEFFDYSCGYCRKVAPSVNQLIEQDRNVRVVMKEFPILGPASRAASLAALAVHAINPSVYGKYHDKLMQVDLHNNEVIVQAAVELGIDKAQLEAKIKSPEVDAVINKNHALASGLGIQGTPAFVIGDQLIPGAVSLDELKGYVAKAREAAASGAKPAESGNVAPTAPNTVPQPLAAAVEPGAPAPATAEPAVQTGVSGVKAE